MPNGTGYYNSIHPRHDLPSCLLERGLAYLPARCHQCAEDSQAWGSNYRWNPYPRRCKFNPSPLLFPIIPRPQFKSHHPSSSTPKILQLRLPLFHNTNIHLSPTRPVYQATTQSPTCPQPTSATLTPSSPRAGYQKAKNTSKVITKQSTSRSILDLDLV